MTPDVFQRRAFTVDGQGFDWADLVTAAHTWGNWKEAERVAVRAVQADTLTQLPDGPPGDNKFTDALQRFRYDRRLLSADELHIWLEGRGLDSESLLQYIRGAECTSPAEPEAGVIDTRKAFQATWVNAVCSGLLRRVGQRLAAHLAVAYASGMPMVQRPLAADEMESLNLAYETFSLRVDDAAARRELEQRHTDWTRLDVLQVHSPDDQMIREIALCVRVDGRLLSDVAYDAGIAIELQHIELQDAAELMRPQMLGARTGELLGPFSLGPADHRLVEILKRQPPSFDDTGMAQRARARAFERAVQHEVADRVAFDELP
ncbi:hypothetical protein [Streptomyces sp. NPDC057910]|uniref:hypothetical protein n=1 Tax=Streptomyces sp. NPDC057910 TaxID=3346278 RepID=UPI0036ED4CF0